MKNCKHEWMVTAWIYGHVEEVQRLDDIGNLVSGTPEVQEVFVYGPSNFPSQIDAKKAKTLMCKLCTEKKLLDLNA